MTLLSRKQQVLLVIAQSGTCSFEIITRELQMPRSTVSDKLLWLLNDRAIERKKVGRFWHFKATKLGQRVADVLLSINKLEGRSP